MQKKFLKTLVLSSGIALMSLANLPASAGLDDDVTHGAAVIRSHRPGVDGHRPLDQVDLKAVPGKFEPVYETADHQRQRLRNVIDAINHPHGFTFCPRCDPAITRIMDSIERTNDAKQWKRAQLEEERSKIVTRLLGEIG